MQVRDYAHPCREFDGAEKQLNRAVELSSNNVDLLILLSSTCRKLGKFGAALEHLESASKAHADDVRWESDNAAAENVTDDPRIVRQRNLVWNDLAVSRAAEGDYTDAVELFTQAIDSQESIDENTLHGTRDRRFYKNRGDAYRALGQYEEALRDYEDARNINGDDEEAKSRMGLIYNEFGVRAFNDGLYNEAVDRFAAALAVRPDEAEYLRNRGDAYHALGMGKEAYEDFMAAAEAAEGKTESEIAARLALFAA